MGRVRALTTVWAAWAWLTALAYLNGPEISHLQPIVAMVAPQWWSWLWATAAALLTLGIPSWRWAGTLRVAGLAATAALSTAWAVSFILMWVDGETTRGWVSAKNYGLTAALAMGSAWWVAFKGRFDQ
ncbi:hypothetical protein [Corynebacterium freneyi]|uniref:CHASE2 domain-containing sensor protein n=1 Tax=Corynebacterium freneyi TaxID=134034 RepID=A0ABS4U9R9_9CORY|nr:hypothetical protein [Corynebacterium freneyi]MBP2333279.1 CHASE2 domain-containing sensor protein [Corynebacterium freneyi]QXA52668.1 hypothetical protein I6L56_11580 [Corynebacterium freneyi]WJZ04617.1 hypothetical protein CFREN_03155 [Corynebacterium freneyi]